MTVFGSPLLADAGQMHANNFLGSRKWKLGNWESNTESETESETVTWCYQDTKQGVYVWMDGRVYVCIYPEAKAHTRAWLK